ncbi:MAG: hypothetical protein WCL02_07450 [bacterium]
MKKFDGLETKEVVFCRYQKGIVESDFGYGEFSVKVDRDIILHRNIKKIFYPTEHVENISKIVNESIHLFTHTEKNPWEKYNPKILDLIEDFWVEMCDAKDDSERVERAKRDFYKFMGELHAVRNVANSLQVNYYDPTRVSLFKF